VIGVAVGDGPAVGGVTGVIGVAVGDGPAVAGVTGVAVADGPAVGGSDAISTNTRSDNAVLLWSSLTIAWLEGRLPGVALALTRTWIVTVAGAPLRASTVHRTVLFA
jgi:hypothetical protein